MARKHWEMGEDTGVSIEGFELWVKVKDGDEPIVHLRTPDRVDSPYGPRHATRHIRPYRDWTDGRVRCTVSLVGSWPGDPFARLGIELSPIAANAAMEVADRYRRKPEPADGPARVDVPGMADIAAAAEAEGTPLAPVALLHRTARRCVECGSLVHGEYCTHCMES